MKIYVGTSGYAYKEWKGIFYPGKIQPKEMLRFYSGHLGAVEINNTFYRMPRETILTSWAEQVPDDFVFAFKAPQAITHLKRLRNVKAETEYLLRTLSVLESKLGPILFQFPNSFHANLPAIKDFLTLIPRTMSCAFEFRNPSWVEAGVADMLGEKGFCLCTAESDDNSPDQIIHTASWGYLRLRRSDYTDADLAEWMKKILAQKWDKVFVFFKHEDETKGPEMALHFKRLMVVPS